jgi:hypothetical protein
MLSAGMYFASITLSVAMKHLRAVEIHPEIKNFLDKVVWHAPPERGVLRKISFSDSSDIAEEEAEIGSFDPIDRGILQALDRQPFA